MAPGCHLARAHTSDRYDLLVPQLNPSPGFAGNSFLSHFTNCRTEAQGLALPWAGWAPIYQLAKQGIIFKKQGLREWQLDTWTTPPGAMDEGRPVEVPAQNKHIKSDTLLKSKAGNYF